jgi:hypothetical protein
MYLLIQRINSNIQSMFIIRFLAVNLKREVCIIPPESPASES